MKNFLSILFLSHGVPMLLMGDELQKTQFGNNNAYCQNNEISWMDWSLESKNSHFLTFVQNLISIRKKYKVFQYENFYKTQITQSEPYLIFHGIQLNTPSWDFHSQSIAFELIYPKHQEHLFFIFNMYWEETQFQLPEGNWQRLFDTNLQEINKPIFTHQYKVFGRTVSLFSRIF